jgi:hypothetical protein
LKGIHGVLHLFLVDWGLLGLVRLSILITPKSIEEFEMDPDKTLEESKQNESTERSVVVAAPPIEEPKASEIPQLGDVIQFDDGRWAGRRGTILYCDVNRILVLPVGGSSKLDSIPMVRREEDGETVKVQDGEAPIEGAEYEIDPELEVSHVSLSKHPLNKFVYDEDEKEFYLQTAPFVVVTNVKPGQLVTTYTKEGSFGPKFRVEEVNEEEDSAVFVQTDEGEESNPYTLEFDYRGIPLNEPFQYFTTAFPPTTQPAPTKQTPEGEAIVDEVNESDELDQDEIEFLDETEEVYQAALEVKAGKAKSVDYTDAEQKSGMFTDLLADSKLSDKQRLQPRRIKKMKVLTEQLFSLRNDFVNYLPLGKGVQGTKKTSFTTVTDILDESKIPLARPIVKSKRALYYDHTPKYFEELKTKGLGEVGSIDPTTSEREDIDVHFLDETIKGSMQYLKSNMTSSMNPDAPEQTSQLPKFYSEFQNYFSLFFSQFPLIDEATTSTPADMDVFRGDVPKTDKEIKTVGGLQRLNVNRDAILDSSLFQTVAVSRLRSIASRSSRLVSNDVVTVENSDVLTVISYLFFPFLYLREFGATRTGDLALDIAQSILPSKTMKMILESNGPIQEKADGDESFDPDKILPLKRDGSLLSNLSIADWLSGQPIYGRGIGDLLPMLTSLGLRNKDLNEAQMKVLIDKINQYNLALRTFLNSERTKADEMAQKTTVQVDSLLNGSAVEGLFKQIWSQKNEGLLPTALLQFAERVPAYKESDIARFAYLYKKYPDLFQDTLAGRPTQEYIRAARSILLQKKKNDLLAERLKKEKVGPPKPNTCEHVAQYTMVKNAKNVGQRMELLAKYVSTYRTEEKLNHWLMCRICDKHLLCEHEFLQIREFMDPLRSKQYHKELLLTFNDGIFGGQYICKNCGQGIQDIEYDNNMEYNDNGVPMIGRGTIEDKDQEIKDEIERLLDTQPAVVVEKIEFADPKQKIIYSIMKRITGLVGVDFPKEAYERLVKQTANFVNLKPRDDFTKGEEERKKKLGQKYTKVSYGQYSSRVFIGMTAAAILIEIQTHVPEYSIASDDNPIASFEGYPLDSTTVSDSQGKEIVKDDRALKYITFALSTIRDEKEPWNQTGFQSITDDGKRQAAIGQSLFNNVKAYTANAFVQQELETKRKYLLQKYGRAPGGTFADEKIPDGFVPSFMKVTKETAAEAPIQELAARGTSRVSGWLLAAHVIARSGTRLSAASKKTLYTCCYDQVSSPLKYWSDKNLPDLGAKDVPKGNRGSFLRIPMTLRDEKTLLGSVDPANMKKLFSKICFRGPRVGYPHEPGYDMKCPYCELTFLYDPRDPLLPLITDELRSKKYSYSKMIVKALEDAENDLLAKKEQSLSNAGVTVNAKEFDQLLDTMHEHYLVPKVALKPISTIQLKLLEELRDIAYPPFGKSNEYKELLHQTIENVRDVQTRKPATENDFTRAYEPIILKVNELEAQLNGQLGKKYYSVFVRMFTGLEKGDSCSKLAQSMLSTYLLPFQRTITKYNKENLVNPPASLKLGPEIVKDIKEQLTNHIVESSYFQPEYTSTKKLRDAVNKLKVLIPMLQNKIRLNTFPGQIYEYPYLPKFLVLGIFVDLLDSDVLPSDYDGSDSFALLEKDKQAPKEFMQKLLEKRNEENLDFTDEYIRNVIEQRNESERQEVLGRFKKLPDSLKALESQKKKLRIGEWSVGGSKAIYTYDEDQYVRERTKREQTNQGDDEVTDELIETEVVTEEEEYEIDAGYDVMDTEDHEDGLDMEQNAGGVSC